VLFSTISFRPAKLTAYKIRHRVVASHRIDYQNCAVWISQTILSKPILYLVAELSKRRADVALGKKYVNMPHISNKPTLKLRKAPQPPLSHPGAPADSDRAKKPPLVEPCGTGQELSPGDRVEALGDFGIPMGEFGTVRQVNEDDAVVKWDDDGRVRLHQPSLKKL
jgi:hypothetical protein